MSKKLMGFKKCQECGDSRGIFRAFVKKVLCRACAIKALKIYLATLSCILILVFAFSTIHADNKPATKARIEKKDSIKPVHKLKAWKGPKANKTFKLK